MRVLFLIHSLSAGGAERVTANLANHWAAAGWLVTVVTMTGREGDFYSLHPNVKRISLRLDAASSQPLAAMLNNWRRVRAIRRVLSEAEPDVAVGIMIKANCLLALAAMGQRLTGVGSEHVHPPASPQGRIWEWLRRVTYRHLRAVTALTTPSADWLIVHTSATRVRVIPNPIAYPLPVQAPERSPEVDRVAHRPHRLLAVGRLADEKGFDHLLNAFSGVAARFPNWELVILGEGPLRVALQEQAQSLALDERVRFPGVVGNVGDWYNSADLYVMTSRYEGFGNTLAEAMTYGLPAISVDCETGPRNILRHEVDGLLVPQDDPAALQAALARLMANEGLRRQYAERAVEARERFAVEKIAAQWEALFEECRHDRKD